MKLMQISSFYTGVQDTGTVKSAGSPVPVDKYRLILQGKSKNDSVIPPIKEPLISFQTANSTGDVTETYIVQGQSYFRLSDSIVHPIGELQSIFGIPVYSITFGGYILDSNNKFIYAVGVNETLFVTDLTYTYKNAGKVSNNFQSYVFVSSADAGRTIACNKYGDIVECEIAIDAQRIPSISKIITSHLPPELYCLRPTGGHPTEKAGTAGRNFTYFNSNFDCLIRINDTTATPYWVSYHITVNGLPTGSLGTGKAYHYQVVKGDEPGSFLLIDSIDDYADDCMETTNYTHNSRFQLKKTAYIHQALDQSQKSFNIQQTEEKEIEYLWESEQKAAREARKTAIGIISQTSVKTVQGAVSRYVQKEQKVYNLRSGATGTERIYYTQTNTMDGLDGNSWTQQHNIYSFNNNGVPVIEESVRPQDSENALRAKQLLVENTALPLAEFRNAQTQVLEYDGSSSHYLGFAPYESFSVKDNKLISYFFDAQDVDLIRTDFLESMGLRFKAYTFLEIGDEFTATPGVTYIFSCYRRQNNAGEWKYFTKKVTGDSLIANKRIHVFTVGQEICHIMLREINCQAKVYIYDPDTFRQTASMDNNGVPTIMVYDQLLRPQMECVPELVRDASIPDEDYFLLTGKFSIYPITIKGYSRFNGFDSAKTEVLTSKLFNSELKAEFFEKAVAINRTGGELSGLQTNTLFASSSRFISGQTVSVIETNNTQLKIVFYDQRAELRRDEIVVKKSEAYLGNAAWAFFVLGRVLLLFIDGKQVLHYVLDRDTTITSVTTGGAAAKANITNSVIIATKLDAEMRYFDYVGNQVQSLKVRYNRLLVSQNIYDRAGNLTVATLPGLYPLLGTTLVTSDNPLQFRNNFAKFDFSDATKPRGILTGELADFYSSSEGYQYVETPTDDLWPYSMYNYEENAGNRIKSLINQGHYGDSKTVSYQYHDISLYQNYASKYGYNENINYSGVKQQMNVGYPNTLFMNQLKGVSGDIFGTQMFGMGNDTSSILNQIMEKENNIAVSDKSQSPTSYQNYFLQGDSVPTMKRSVSTASRLFYSESLDSGIHGILYDSYGNKRLVWSNGDTLFRYFKYDLFGRVVESGTVTLTGELKDYIDKVNAPDFPTESEGSRVVCFLFSYDSILDYGEEFCMGRLCAVENNPSSSSKIKTTFKYDSDGRTVSYQSVSVPSSLNLTYTFEFNSHGDPIKIIYPAALGWQTEYSYNDFGKESTIILRKTDGSQFVRVLGQAKYNIFDELGSYFDALGEKVITNYNMMGSIIKMGNVDKQAFITKSHTSWCDPYLPGTLDVNNGSEKAAYSITIDELMRITDINIDKSDSSKIYHYQYDLKDNLKLVKNDDQLFTLEYKNNRFVKAKDSASQPVAAAAYAEDGLMETYSSTSNFELVRDNFFPYKYQQIYSVSYSSSLYFSYDCYGNKLMEGNTANGMFYAYSNLGHLDFTFKSSEYGRNTIYIYCGSKMIGEFFADDQQMIGLMYDESDTLCYMSYISNGAFKCKAFEYSNPFGKVSGYGTDIPKVTFLYNGMQYLEFINGYDIDGMLYFPEYGITSAPSLNQTFKTPYRPFWGQPIR